MNTNLMSLMNKRFYLVTNNSIKSKMLLVLIVLLSSIVGISQNSANPAPLIWGEIDKANFQLTAPSFSPDATSLTICRYGQTYVGESVSTLETRTDVHERFIVLHADGIDRADISIAFWTGSQGNSTKSKDVKKVFSGAYRGSSNGHKVENIDACVYNIDDNGKVTSSKLDSDKIFVQDFSDIYGYGALIFAVPNVKVGSIVEYKYTIVKKYIFSFKEWYFQTSNPCLHSELRVSFPDKNAYAIIKQGLLKDRIKFSQSTLSSVNVGREYDKVYSYTLDSIPALADEPYVMSMNNFRTKVMIQISEHYNRSTNTNEKIISTWKLLANEYKYDDDFGRQLNRYSSLYSKFDYLWTNSPSEIDKIKSCYNFVRDHFTCNNKPETMASNNLKEVYTESAGSAVEINLFLAGLLKKAGFTPVMALVSTRKHGTINEKYPFVTQFNHAICVLEIDGKTLFLDASVKQGNYAFPPAKIVDCRAFVVDPKNPIFMDITTSEGYNKFVMCTGNIVGDSLQGKLQFKFNGYAAALQRKIFNGDEEEYFKDEVNSKEQLDLSNPKMVNANNGDKPFLTQVDYSARYSSLKTDELLYINPFEIYGNFDNELTAKSREFPIEFNYPYKITYMYSITIPPGYEVEDVPENRTLSMFDNAASVLFHYQIISGLIQIKTELKINQTEFPPKEYDNLKTLFEIWELKHNEMIVLKRSL